MKPYIILRGTLEEVAAQTNDLIDQFYEPQGLTEMEDGSWMQPMYRSKDAEERRRVLAEVQGEMTKYSTIMEQTKESIAEATDKTLEQSRLMFAKGQSDAERRHKDYLGLNG